MQPKPLPTQDRQLVACLCADWCGTCQVYRASFNELQHEFPQTLWLWVDIEDNADLVEPVEVDDFPTLLIATQGEPLFFGTVTPHQDTLRRLVQTYQKPTGQPLGQANVLRPVVKNLYLKAQQESRCKPPEPGQNPAD